MSMTNDMLTLGNQRRVGHKVQPNNTLTLGNRTMQRR